MDFITLDGMVINTETGEVLGTVEQFESAVAFLASEPVDTTDLFINVETSSKGGKQYKATEKKEGQGVGGGRKAVEVANPYREWAFELDTVPAWLDDVLTGVGRQQTNNTVVPFGQVFGLLKTLEVISTATVKAALNKKRIALGDKVVGDSYARQVASTLRNAINALDYHLERLANPLPIINVETSLEEEVNNDTANNEFVFYSVKEETNSRTAYGAADWLTEL